MTKPIDYLKQYAGKYYVTHLGVILPRRVGYRLEREMPDIFAVHQDAEDGVALLFPEDRLDGLADTLKLRRRRKALTPEQIERQVAALTPFRFKEGAIKTAFPTI